MVVLPATAIRHYGLPGDLLIFHLTINGDEMVLVDEGGPAHYMSDFPRILPDSSPRELRCTLVVESDDRLMGVKGELVRLCTTLWLIEVARLLLLFMLG